MQFFDQRVWWVWAGTLGAFGLSALAYGTWWMAPLLLLALVAQAELTRRSLILGLCLVVYETFIGGHGHLWSLAPLGIPLGLRMVLFGGLWVGYAGRLWQGASPWPRLTQNHAPWIAWLGAVALAVVVGAATHALPTVFDDANGYATLTLLIPAASLAWTREEKRWLLLSLVAAVGWLCMASLVLLFTFSHLPSKVLDDVYRFVRDTRLYEVTLISNDSLSQLFPSGAWYFRAFSYGQVLAGMTAFLAGWAWAVGQRSRALWWVMIASLAGLLGSLSRSALVGAALAGTLALPLLAMLRPKLSAVWSALWRTALATAAAVALLWAAVAVPPRPDISNWPFYKGAGGNSRGTAVSSRWNLLPPLNEKIAQHPVFGSGLGDSVTYISDDPRIRDINPTGEYTTMRVEWGFHDLWWKLGLPGVFSLLWLMAQLTKQTFRATGDDRWLTYGAFGMIIVLLGTNIFSPYLNHPIGIVGLLAASWLMSGASEQKLRDDRREDVSLRHTPNYRTQPVATRT